MAIPYGAKLFESEATSRVTAHPLGAAVKAGSLLCIAVAGKRPGAYLNLASIGDTRGNRWAWRMFQSEFRAVGVAYCRTDVPMSASDRITVSWNGTPSYAWKSAHSFEGAGADPLGTDTNSGTSGTASEAVAVAGSDWLVFGAVMLPNAGSGGLTLLNSAVSRDDNGHSGPTPWAECFSRNGSGGGSYTGGATLPGTQQWGVCVVSFPALAMPGGSGAPVFAFLP